MRRLWVVVLCACGEPQPPQATPGEDAALQQPLEVPAGGRATIQPQSGSQVTDVEVTSSGGLIATRLDATRWELKAPYEPVDAAVKLWLHCGDRGGAADLRATTRRPKWRALAQWTDGTPARPKNREYGVMCLDGEDRLLVAMAPGRSTR